MRSCLCIYLTHRGYAAIGAKTAADSFSARIRDREQISEAPGSSLFQRYLEAGGRVVWVGTPPLLWELDSAGKPPGLNAFKWNAPTELLGFDHKAAIFDERIVRSTSDGLRWGLPRQWRASWGIDPIFLAAEYRPGGDS